MTKFEEFLQAKTKPKGIMLDMSGSCQICHEYVDEAEYFPVERLLRWVCTEKHISYIEDFKL